MYDWLQTLYKGELVTEAQNAVNEYNKWSNNPCSYDVPGGQDFGGDFTYSGNQPYGVCYGYCFSFAGCPTTPPTVEDFEHWGVYEGLSAELNQTVPVSSGGSSKVLQYNPIQGILSAPSRRSASRGRSRRGV